MKPSKNAPPSAPKSVTANWTSLPESAKQYWWLRDRAIEALSELLHRSDMAAMPKPKVKKRRVVDMVFDAPPPGLWPGNGPTPKARKGGRR